jgi:hypothetical protein
MKLKIILFFYILSSCPLISQQVTFRNFGAIGDGITDDTKAVNEALKSSKKVYGVEGDKYRITSTITINHDVSIDVTGSGKFSFEVDGKETLFHFIANQKNDDALLINAANTGDELIEMTSTTDISNGDLIRLNSTEFWEFQNRGKLRKGEVHIVENISGKKIFLRDKIHDDYSISKEKVFVRAYKPLQIELKNFDVNYNSGSYSTAIIIERGMNCVISNISINNSGRKGISIKNSYNIDIRNSSFSGANSETGYGISGSGAYFLTIDSCNFYNNRAAVDFSGGNGYKEFSAGPSRYCVMKNSFVNGSGLNSKGEVMNEISKNRGGGTHGPAEFCIFENNLITNVSYGFTIRGKDIYVRNNTFKNVKDMIVNLSAGMNFKFTGNKYIYDENESIPAGINLKGDYLLSDGFTVISENELYLRGELLTLFGKIKNLTVTDNSLFLTDRNNGKNKSNVFLLNGSKDAFVSDSEISGNEITILNGVYKMINPVVTVVDSHLNR